MRKKGEEENQKMSVLLFELKKKDCLASKKQTNKIIVGGVRMGEGPTTQTVQPLSPKLAKDRQGESLPS